MPSKVETEIIECDWCPATSATRKVYTNVEGMCLCEACVLELYDAGQDLCQSENYQRACS